jgi:hypothetical protein
MGEFAPWLGLLGIVEMGLGAGVGTGYDYNFVFQSPDDK